MYVRLSSCISWFFQKIYGLSSQIRSDALSTGMWHSDCVFVTLEIEIGR